MRVSLHTHDHSGLAPAQPLTRTPVLTSPLRSIFIFSTPPGRALSHFPPRSLFVITSKQSSPPIPVERPASNEYSRGSTYAWSPSPVEVESRVPRPRRGRHICQHKTVGRSRAPAQEAAVSKLFGRQRLASCAENVCPPLSGQRARTHRATTPALRDGAAPLHRRYPAPRRHPATQSTAQTASVGLALLQHTGHKTGVGPIARGPTLRARPRAHGQPSPRAEPAAHCTACCGPLHARASPRAAGVPAVGLCARLRADDEETEQPRVHATQDAPARWTHSARLRWRSPR